MFLDNLFCNQDQEMIDAGRDQGQGDPVSQTKPTQQKVLKFRHRGIRYRLSSAGPPERKRSGRKGRSTPGKGQTEPKQTVVLIDRGGSR